MKKIVLTTVCLLALTRVAFAGTFTWEGFNFNAITIQTNSTVYFGGIGPTGGGAVGAIAPAAIGSSFYFELLYNTAFTGSQTPQPSLVSLLNGNWLDTGLTATNSLNPGRIVAVNPSLTATVSGWPGGVGVGTTNNIMLVGWSANLGTSWSDVQSVFVNWQEDGYLYAGISFFGMSNTGYVVPGEDNSGFPGAVVFGTGPSADGLPINSPNTQLYVLPDVLVVPEPATVGLAGLGGLVLLGLRRRK